MCVFCACMCANFTNTLTISGCEWAQQTAPPGFPPTNTCKPPGVSGPGAALRRTANTHRVRCMKSNHQMLLAEGFTHTHTQSYLPLPVGAVDQDQALWERRVRQQNLVQLVVHHLPQELHTHKQTHTYTHFWVHKPPWRATFTLQMTHQRIHNSCASSRRVIDYQDACAFFTLGKDKTGVGGGGRGTKAANV